MRTTALFIGDTEDKDDKDDWKNKKYWLNIIHIFDPQGMHITSIVDVLGNAEDEEETLNSSKELMDDLIDETFESSEEGDVDIEEFFDEIDTEIGPVEVGLILNEDEEMFFIPENNIIFVPPYDGRHRIIGS